MKLDRNINPDGTGKYALIKMRAVTDQLSGSNADRMRQALRSLESLGVIDYGDGMDSDFFVIRTRDKYAGPALRAHEAAARKDDPEFADEVGQIALNAETHPKKQTPD